MKVFVLIEVPDGMSQEDVATDLEGAHLYLDDISVYTLDNLKADLADGTIDRIITSCGACRGKRFIIADVDGTGQLRIERCDGCSADTLTDDEVQELAGAQAALTAARKWVR